MKIVYCIPSLYNPGGMERVLTAKVNYLVSVLNYEITIITTDQNNRSLFFSINDSVRVVDLNLNFEEHFNANLLSKFVSHKKKCKLYKSLLDKYLIDNKIDICVSLCGKEIDFLTSLKAPCKKVAEIHFSQKNRAQFILSRKSSLFWKVIAYYRTKQLIKSTLKLDKLVVLTKRDLLQWEKTNDNVIQIYNPSLFISQKVSSLENKIMISVGRLDAQKGYDWLIQVWKLVAYRYPDWELHIYGQGEWFEKLTAMIDAYGLKNTVLLKGITNNMDAVYLSGAAYVMSSRYEGFPMVLLEAICYGLPIVSFDCEFGPSEIVKDGYNGYIVPVRDFELMSEKICNLIENAELRCQMGKNAKLCSIDYDLALIMPKWKSVFELLLN